MEAHDLGSEQKVVYVFQCVVEPRSLISTILEMPEVVLCVPRAFPLIMVRGHIEGASVLTPVSRDNPYDMGVRAHNDPSVLYWGPRPFAVSDDAGDIVGTTIEIEP